MIRMLILMAVVVLIKFMFIAGIMGAFAAFVTYMKMLGN